MARIARRIAGIGASDLPDAAAFDAYVGPAREITVDQQRGIIALHDGVTPGGQQFHAGGGGDGDTAIDPIPKSFAGKVGTNQTYTLDLVPATAGNVLVYVGGIRQVPGVDYTVSGATLTILSNPEGLEVDTLLLAGPYSLTFIQNGSVTEEKLADEAVTENKIDDGAVTTSKLSSDLQETISDIGFAAFTVARYGAVGDGVADDTAAFNAMMSATNCIVLEPRKTYKVKDIFVANGQSLVGNGARLTPAAGAKWLVRATGYRPVIRNIEVEDVEDEVIIKTAVAVSATAGATTLQLASAVGVEVGQFIALRLDDDSYHGCFVTGVSGATVSLQTQLPNSAAATLPVIITWGMLHVSGAVWAHLDTIFGVNVSVFAVIDRGVDGEVTSKSIINNVLCSNVKYAGLVEGRDVADLSVHAVQLRGGHVEVKSHTGDGSSTEFGTEWPIFLDRDVSVTVNGAPETEFSVVSKYLIEFSTPPADGASIEISNFTDGWFGHFNDQTGWSTIRGGCQYSDMHVLDFYYGRKLRAKELSNFSQCITDTCFVGEHLRGCTAIVYDNHFCGYVAANIDIGESSRVTMGGSQTLTQVPSAMTAGNAVGDVIAVESGSVLRLDTSALAAESLKRGGTGKLFLTGGDIFRFASSDSVAASTTVFLGVLGNNAAAANGFVADRDCLIVGFTAQVADAPGVDQTFSYDVTVNGSPTSLTGTISGAGAFSTENSSPGIAVAKGESVHLRVQTSSGAMATAHRGFIQFV